MSSLSLQTIRGTFLTQNGEIFFMNSPQILTLYREIVCKSCLITRWQGGGKRWEVSGNRQVAEALSRWLLKESGVLRVKSVAHRPVGEATPPPAYTIMDDVVSLVWCTVQ
jgi:hypothetical protein